MFFKKHKDDIFGLYRRMASHVAVFERVRSPLGRESFTLSFIRPGTVVDSIYYVLRGGLLTVYGDLYEASYLWSGRINWAFLSSCNLGYFASKCRSGRTYASGRVGQQWYPEKASKFLLGLMEQQAEEADDEVTVDRMLERDGLTRGNVKEAAQHEYTFAVLLNENSSAFGQDAWELIDLGSGASVETKLHLLGIHYAMQLVGDGNKAWVPYAVNPSDTTDDVAAYAPSETAVKEVKVIDVVEDGGFQGWCTGAKPGWLAVREEDDAGAIPSSPGDRGAGAGDS